MSSRTAPRIWGNSAALQGTWPARRRAQRHREPALGRLALGLHEGVAVVRHTERAAAIARDEELVRADQLVRPDPHDLDRPAAARGHRTRPDAAGPARP